MARAGHPKRYLHYHLTLLLICTLALLAWSPGLIGPMRSALGSEFGEAQDDTTEVHEGGLIEVERLGSLNLSLKNEGGPVEATNLCLYQLAELQWGAEGSLWSWVPKDAFVDLDPEKLKQNDEAELARALNCAQKEKPLYQQTTDSQGNLNFEKLPTGMYLVTQGNGQDSKINMSPFCVCIPMLENDSYVYDVDATPKVLISSNGVADQENHQESTSSVGVRPIELPKTGDIAPLTLVAILLLLSFGGCFVARGWPPRKRKHSPHSWKGDMR